MYLFSDRLYKQDEIELLANEKQIIFTSAKNQKIIDWLIVNQFPESFIEDIVNQDQSITYEENEKFKLIILKNFEKSDEDEYLYEDENIAIIVTETKFIFLSSNQRVLKNIVSKLYRRYRPKDTLEYTTYIVLDILIDDTMKIIEFIGYRLEEIEDSIFAQDIDEEQVQRGLYFTRRSLNRISKVSIQEFDVVNKIFNHLPTVARKKLKYEFIDLKEHITFLVNESKNYLDRTGYLQNLLTGVLSNRMNQAMQRLAGISLIFLPLTFIVGNYGMNFETMPETRWEYSYYVVWGTNIAIGYGIFRWLKKKKWL